MSELADRTRRRLLRDAEDNPQDLLRRKKFWRLEFWPHYLYLCDDVLLDDPHRALPLTAPAPELAAILCKELPGVNGADLMLLGHSHLGSALRTNDAPDAAELAFAEAKTYTPAASPPALAQYLRRFAYHRLCQDDPECFPLIEEGLALYKIGNLVNRHGIGEMLLCRGCANFQFHQHGRAFDDWTAALSHLDMTIDPKPWYGAIHNLALCTVEHGTLAQLEIARANIKPAQRLLKTFYARQFAKLKMRWVIALLDARLGAEGHAEFELLEILDSLIELKLPLESGWLITDLARLYLRQGRYHDLKSLRQKMVAIFRDLEGGDRVQEAIDLWHDAERVDDDLLKRIRESFYTKAKSIPLGIAA